MKFNVISIMPDLIESMLKDGVVGSAFQKGICSLNTINPRSFTSDVHQTIDDRPFGGGDGMVMMAEPLQKSLDSLRPINESTIYYLSPQGKVLTDEMATELSEKNEITFVCGRYAGVDQRFLNKNNIQEISIGDYVISGGELAALVVMDAVIRKIPGVLGHAKSASEDSFAMNGILEAPSFTRPREVFGMEVPETLLSGDHKKIDHYKELLAILVTLQKRPELLLAKNVEWKKIKDFLEKISDKECQSLGLLKDELLDKVSRLLRS